jgi:protein SCO1/2
MNSKTIVSLVAIALLLAAAVIYKKYNIGHESLDLLTAAPSGGDFVLQSNQGEFRLAEQRGKLVLIYFGYTFCPEICPTNLAVLTQALNELNEQELQQIQSVFISVDPARDTLEHLQNYTQYFHQNIIGLTADAETVADVARRYGAAYRKVTGESKGGYLIDHSSFIYLVDRRGQLKHSFPHATDPRVMVNTIRQFLDKD